MNNKLFFTGFLIVCIFLACEKEDPIIQDPLKPISATGELPEAIQTFGAEVFQELVRQEEDGKNLIISPLSIATTLYMTYNGSDGETRQAMANTLALEEVSADSLNGAFYTLSQWLQPRNDSVELKLANAFFYDQSRITPFESFLTALGDSYDATDFPENFLATPQATLDRINAWVKDKTEGRIDKILEELDPREIVFLINALYFIGDWDNPFDADFTSPSDFFLGDGSVVEAHFMNQDNYLDAYIANDYQAVSLAFADTNFTMCFVLPPENCLIDEFINTFDFSEFYDKLNPRFSEQRVLLILPKFEINYKVKLNAVLKSMGMEIAFDRDRANFTKIGNVAYGNPYISRVEHKTFLKIDEKGAEGAAVTAVGIAIDSAPPTLRFNRPFIIMLTHKASCIPIFLGKIENPISDK